MMTKKEERELQLKEILEELSERLPYGVKILHISWNYEWDQELCLVERVVGIDGRFVNTKVIDTDTGEEYRDDCLVIERFGRNRDRIYLRPLSSMTKDEEEEIGLLEGALAECGGDNGEILKEIRKFYCSHHLDNNGLIGKGLARPAPEWMYKDTVS